jgi:acetoin utilization protein AcuB
MIKELLQATKLKDVMTSPVITVATTDEFHMVQEKLVVYDIRHLPVVDENGRIVGLISQRHLYKIHSPRRLESGEWYYDKDMLDSFILKNVMVKEPFVLGPDNTLEEATVQFKFVCIPVVDADRKPVGIITRDTVINFFLGS